MSLSNVKPVYPNGIIQWVDRVDNVSIDYANDINSVVSDLESVEITLGANPQVESNPPTGMPITYNTVSDRISDAMSNSNLPVCSLSANQQAFSNVSVGHFNNYQKNYDPYKMHNGTDVTAPINGWYSVNATQVWTWQRNGYVYTALCLNGTSNIISDDLIDWQFSGNVVTGIVGNAVSPGLPRWQQFGLRNRLASLSWEGLLHEGDRLSVTSENGTSTSSVTATNMFLKVACLRTLPSNTQFTSG